MAIPKSVIDHIRQRRAVANEPIIQTAKPDTRDDEYIPLGLDGLLAASSKLLHINRGLAEPDDRDGYQFKRLMRPDTHLAERINLDAGKIRNNLIWRVTRDGNLNSIKPGAFDSYTTGLLIGTSDEPNQLSAPLEETNPMHLLENANRAVMMGQGGISSSDQITSDAQAINGTQFGFIDPIAGPESERAGVDVRFAKGVRFSNTGRIYQQFRNARTNEVEWVDAETMSKKVLAMPD